MGNKYNARRVEAYNVTNIKKSHKKGDNYRGIPLVNVVSKIFAISTNERLDEIMGKIVGNF